MLIRIIIILSEWAGLERGGGRQNVVISNFGMGLLSQLINLSILLIKYTNHLLFTHKVFLFKILQTLATWNIFFDVKMKFPCRFYTTKLMAPTPGSWIHLKNSHQIFVIFMYMINDGCKNSIVWWMGLRLIFSVIISLMRGWYEALIIPTQHPNSIRGILEWPCI